MSRINVNLNDVESSGFMLFPDGPYLVEIQSSSKLMQSDAGAYIRWIAKCIEGEMEGKLIGWNTSLLPQALWNIKAMLEAADVEWDEEGFEIEDVFGAQFIIDVSTRTIEQGRRQGELGNQVDGYHSAAPAKKKK
jgi:hypothetical protein